MGTLVLFEDALKCKRGTSIYFRFSIIQERLSFYSLYRLSCRFVFVASACTIFVLSAYAGPIVANPALECGKGYACVSVTGSRFNVSSATALAGNRGVLHFLNSSGKTWNKVILTETGMPAVDIDCSSKVFTCTVVAFGDDGAKIILTSGKTSTGILSGRGLEVNCGGPCPSQLEVSAVPLPEPNGALILLAGIVTTLMSLRRGAFENRLSKRSSKG